MTGTGRRDLTEDPLSSAAEGDADPGSAALAAEDPEDADGAGDGREPTFSDLGPPPEAADPTPVTDAVPETHLGAPESRGGTSAP